MRIMGKMLVQALESFGREEEEEAATLLEALDTR
jgi:hypothetical protein